jgi:hypothetical protein
MPKGKGYGGLATIGSAIAERKRTSPGAVDDDALKRAKKKRKKEKKLLDQLED